MCHNPRMLDLAQITTEQLASLGPEGIAYLRWQSDWYETARPDQIPPDDDWNECGYMAGRGYGKGLILDTPIPTPDGWKRNGDLRDGDTVFDEQGQPCRVVQAHAPYTPKALYRLTFGDGSTLDADGEHLWATWTHAQRKRWLRAGNRSMPGDWATRHAPRDTKHLIKTLRHSTRGDRNHCIPVTRALVLPGIELPLDPWLLGYWLGNGAQRDSTVSCHQDDVGEVCARFAGHGFMPTPLKNGRDFYAKGLVVLLRGMNLLRNKHVPAVYLRASAAQRAALLAGLIDSDGHCALESGCVEFCSKDRVLADAVSELAVSLSQKPVIGTGRAMLNGVDHGEKYRVTWRPTVQPFELPRKAAAWRAPDGQATRNQHRMIASIEPRPIEQVRCLTVDSPSRLYLAGRAMVPTHNTRIGAEWLARKAYDDPSGFDSFVICPTQGDIKKVAFEGESGLLNVIPPELIVDHNKTELFIIMKNCAGGTSKLQGFSAEQPERLRGPQSTRVWGDEISSWGYGEDTWDMMQFGLRLGKNPQVLWTTTPKPKELIRTLTMPREGRIIIRGSTYDNKANLPDSFFRQVEQYEGTKLGRQELEGELLDPEESGIIKRSWFHLWPAKRPLPVLEWIIMSLDTAFTEATWDKKSGDPDYSACTVWGSFKVKHESHVILLDCWAEQLGLPDLVRKVKRELEVAYGDDEDAALLKPLFGSGKPVTSGRKVDLCVIEDKGSGISLRQVLEREGIVAYAYNPGRADKLTRLHMVSPVFARRRVWLPESEKQPGKPKTWIEPVLAQLCSFTGSGSIKHDDFVDSVSEAVRLMMDKGLVTVLKEVPNKDKDAAEVAPPRKRVANPYAA